MEHYQPLDDYEGFQRKVSITNHNGTFYYVVMISRQGSDGSIESEVIVSDSEIFLMNKLHVTLLIMLQNSI